MQRTFRLQPDRRLGFSQTGQRNGGEARQLEPKMEQILNDLLVALTSFDCHRANGLLTVAVAEYQAGNDIRDYLWTRKPLLPHAPAAKLAEFAAKRGLPEVGKPMQGQNPLG